MDKLPGVVTAITGDSFTSGVVNGYCRLMFILGDDVKVSLQAEGDCCSASWIEFVDKVELESLVGRQLVSVDDLGQRVDLPDSEVQDFDKNDKWKLVFSDGEIPFYLRNSSNGYYSGWLYIT